MKTRLEQIEELGMTDPDLSKELQDITDEQFSVFYDSCSRVLKSKDKKDEI